MKPSIFDTRQSFLMKMHNPVMRKNFINSFKRLKLFIKFLTKILLNLC